MQACSLIYWAWNKLCRRRIFHAFRVDMGLEEANLNHTRLFLYFITTHHFQYTTDPTLVVGDKIHDTPPRSCTPCFAS